MGSAETKSTGFTTARNRQTDTRWSVLPKQPQASELWDGPAFSHRNNSIRGNKNKQNKKRPYTVHRACSSQRRIRIRNARADTRQSRTQVHARACALRRSRLPLGQLHVHVLHSSVFFPSFCRTSDALRQCEGLAADSNARNVRICAGGGDCSR